MDLYSSFWSTSVVAPNWPKVTTIIRLNPHTFYWCKQVWYWARCIIYISWCASCRPCNNPILAGGNIHESYDKKYTLRAYLKKSLMSFLTALGLERRQGLLVSSFAGNQYECTYCTTPKCNASAWMQTWIYTRVYQQMWAKPRQPSSALCGDLR